MAGKVKDLTDATFDATVSQGVTLVDFWAPWCPPCRMQGPIVEKLADSFDGKAVIAKVNVDEQANAAAKYGVSNIPTLVILKDGKEVKRFVGLQNEEALRSGVDAFLKA
ncbi:MAG: thioredoxin [Planctomycetota bacterium]|nr:thioredoxin [Planctomycetota bacterium]